MRDELDETLRRRRRQHRRRQRRRRYLNRAHRVGEAILDKQNYLRSVSQEFYRRLRSAHIYVEGAGIESAT